MYTPLCFLSSNINISDINISLGIHFRILNRSKGYAVQGPRAQADRDLYKKYMQEELSSTPNLTIKEGSVDDLIISTSQTTFHNNSESSISNHHSNSTSTDINNHRVEGVILSSQEKLLAKSVVLTTGNYILPLNNNNNTLTFVFISLIMMVGTFLGGIVYIGSKSFSSGRIGEDANNAL